MNPRFPGVLRAAVSAGLVSLLSLALSACGDGNGRSAANAGPGVLTEAERQDLANLASEIEHEGFARPIFPTYVPVGLKRVPIIFQKIPTIISSEFSGRSDGKGTYPLFLEINQYPPSVPEDVVPSNLEPENECSFGSEAGWKCVDLDGQLAVLQVPEPGYGTLPYALSFDVGDSGFLMRLDWETDDPSPSQSLLDRLEQEIIRVAESMLDQR